MRIPAVKYLIGFTTKAQKIQHFIYLFIQSFRFHRCFFAFLFFSSTANQPKRFCRIYSPTLKRLYVVVFLDGMIFHKYLMF